MRYSCSVSSPVPWNTTFRLGKRGHDLFAWLSSQIAHFSMEFSGNSLFGCLFLHFGQNISMVLSNFGCFCFTCRVSICADRVLRISVLKLSSRFSISDFVTPPLDPLADRIPSLFLTSHLEHWIHKLKISSNVSLEMSPFPTMFNSSIESSQNDQRRIIFKISLSRVEWPDLYKVY